MKIQTVLMAYNRPMHTQQVLAGMKSEKITRFKIFVDKAETAHDREKQEELNTLFSTIDWADFDVEYRQRKLGLASSIVQAVTNILQDNDAVIVLEDDCVPQSGFKKYMEFSLKEFRFTKKIRSVCGYTYPGINPTSIKSDIYFLDRFCPWGWATWQNRWKDYDSDLSLLVERLGKLNRPLSIIGKDIGQYCSDEKILNQKAQIWSLNWILNHFLSETLAAYPKYSLIDNVGFDGSGVHSKRTDIFNITETNFVVPAHFNKMNIQVDPIVQTQAVQFLEKYSKMTMVLNDEVNNVHK